MRPLLGLTLRRTALVFLASSTIGACGAGGVLSSKDEPSAADVDEYFEEKFPPVLDVEDVQIETFIDPVSKQGRVSAKGDLVLTAPIYRKATSQEINDRYNAAGFEQLRERWLYVRNEPPFVVEVAPAASRYPFKAELTAAKQVEGWNIQATNIEPSDELQNGDGLETFGDRAVALESEAGQAYFDRLAVERAGAQERDEALFRAFQKRFPMGKPIHVRLSYPNSARTLNLRLTPDKGPDKRSFDDGSHRVSIAGRLEYLDDGWNMTCTKHGGPAYRSPFAEISAQLKRAAQDGVVQPYYELDIGVWDPGWNKYCFSGTVKSTFQNGQVTPGKSTYSAYWTVM